MAQARQPRRSSIGVPIDQLTEFWQVWDCLRDCGWTQVRVGGDPRFVRPGCASAYGAEGFEWFGDDDAVQAHLADHCVDGRERTGELAWWELWDALRDRGWKRHRSGKLLAPGGSIEGEEGVEWFGGPDAVVAFRKTEASAGSGALTWGALEALGWKEDTRGPHGRKEPRYLKPDGVSARRGGVQGEDFFKSKEDALAWATGDKPLDDDVLEVAPASPQPRLTQDSPSDDEEASQRRMSCPIEALGLGDTPRWPVFRNSPVPFDESYGDRAQAKKPPRRAPSADSDDGWAGLWTDLKRVGWSRATPSGLETERFLRPGAQHLERETMERNRHYFICRDAVRDFVKSRRIDCDELTGHLDEDGPSSSDDEIVPETSIEVEEVISAQSPEVEEDASPVLRDTPLWRRSPHEIWKTLRDHGWTYKTGDLEYQWHYLRPGARRKGGVLGIDYFGSEEQVHEFVERKRIDLIRTFGHVDEDAAAPVEPATQKGTRRQQALKAKPAVKSESKGFAPQWRGPWAQSWAKLRGLGWEWRYGPHGATRWVRPGALDEDTKNLPKDARAGCEFFEDGDAVLAFCQEWQVGFKARTGAMEEVALMGRARAPRKSQGEAKGRRRKAPERLAKKSVAKKKPKKLEKAKARAAAKRGAAGAQTAIVKRRDSHEGLSPSQKPLYKLPLQSMWQRLRADHGWKDARGDALRPWFYLRPGASEKRSEWKEGREYFATQEDLKEWCVDHRIDGVERCGAMGEELKPSKAPLISLKGADLWQRLREVGWIKRASTDASKPPWRFFRPGADVLEVPPTRDHFFCSLEDVADFVVSNAIDGVERTGEVSEVYKAKKGKRKKAAPAPASDDDDDNDEPGAGGGGATTRGGPRGGGGGPSGGGSTRPRRGRGKSGGSGKPPPRKRGRGGGGPRADNGDAPDDGSDAPDRGGCAVAAAAPRTFGRELTNGSAAGAPALRAPESDDEALRVEPPSPSAPLLTQAAAPMSDDDDDDAPPLSRSSSDASAGRRSLRRAASVGVSYAEPSCKAKMRRSEAGAAVLVPSVREEEVAASADDDAPATSDDDDDALRVEPPSPSAPPLTQAAAATSDDDDNAQPAMSDDDAAAPAPSADAAMSDDDAAAPSADAVLRDDDPAARHPVGGPTYLDATAQPGYAAMRAAASNEAVVSPPKQRRPCPAWDERGWDALLAQPQPDRWRVDLSLAPFVEEPAQPVRETKVASPSKRRGASHTEDAPASIAARVFDAAYEAFGNNFGALYSRLLKPRGWTYANTANVTGGLYTAPGAKHLTEKVAGVHTFESADEVLCFVREDPGMARELRKLAGDGDTSGGDHYAGPSCTARWRQIATPPLSKKDRPGVDPNRSFVQASGFFAKETKEKRGGKRKGYDGAGRRPGKRSRRLDARDARLQGEEERQKALLAQAAELVLPSVAEARQYKDEAQSRMAALLAKDQRRQFGAWRSRLLGGGVALLLQGFGSKYDLLSKFTDEILREEGEVIVVKGFEGDLDLRLELLRAATHLKLRLSPPTAEERGTAHGVAKRFAAACAKAQRDIFVVVHSIDGKRLRNQDCQSALSVLNSPNSFLVASSDHVNAPLLWNPVQWRKANFCSEDCTTFAPYDREAGKWDPFDRQTIKKNERELDTSGLSYVLRSLTPRHVELLRLLASAQQASPEDKGMLFKALQSQCRYKMIAHTEDQVHSYLVELTDHGLCSKEVRSGSTYVTVAPGYVNAILAAT